MQNTVFLGSTNFPQPTPEKALFQLSVKVSPNESWTLLDGPPYANGNLHMGHVRNKLTKDVVARAQAKKKSVVWRAGWDCHGLPVERNVEKLGYSHHDKQNFVLQAFAYANEQVQLQKQQLEQLGTMCDLENHYKTMDAKQQADTLRVFARMVELGHVYGAYKPVSWCVECESTVANMESEEMSLSSKDLYFQVQLSDSNYAYVWTTQAWSLYYHDALLVHPDATYVLYKCQQEGQTRNVWLCESSLVPEQWNAEVLKKVHGHELAELAYTMVWTNKEHRVKTSQNVNPEAGTGWLHASAACAVEDYEALQHHSSDSLNMPAMKPDGVLPQTLKKFWVTQTDVCTWYAEHDYPWSTVVSQKRMRPHCWRHKCALTVRPTLQWYVRMDDNTKQRAFDRLNKVAFVPETARSRLFTALQDRPDWCVSRQRTWGVPLGLYANESGQLAPFAVSDMRNLADQVEQHGVSALYNLPMQKDEYTLCTDVLDVWFDSGCCFLTTTENDVDMVVEGHDQHRGWFQSSLLVSAVLDEKLPYKKVVCHGFVLDAAKQKLAKSNPTKSKMPTWENVHADVLRVWTTMGNVESDRLWDEESLTMAKKATQKMRNTWRFCLANMSKNAAKDHTKWTSAERWMAYKTQETVLNVLQFWQNASFEMAFASLYTLCNDTLSGHAFSMLKDRLYCGSKEEHETVQEVLHEVSYWLRQALDCLLPCTMAESDEVQPVSLQKMEASLEWDPVWSHLLEWRTALNHEFSKLSTKGAGTMQHASVPYPDNAGHTPDEDLLQWSGASALHEKEPLYVLKGYRCNRCRWVFNSLNEHCERCVRRGYTSENETSS